MKDSITTILRNSCSIGRALIDHALMPFVGLRENWCGAYAAQKAFQRYWECLDEMEKKYVRGV